MWYTYILFTFALTLFIFAAIEIRKTSKSAEVNTFQYSSSQPRLSLPFTQGKRGTFPSFSYTELFSLSVSLLCSLQRQVNKPSIFQVKDQILHKLLTNLIHLLSIFKGCIVSIPVSLCQSELPYHYSRFAS
jgi:hypothetical protein